MLARYDLERAAATLTRKTVESRPHDLWRFRELMPLRDDNYRVTLDESETPIVGLPRFGHAIGVAKLAVKDDGLLPTGSFKARGAAVGVSRARELGVKAFAMPTNGNAGAAWSAYGRRAGMEARIAMPKAAPEVHRRECEAVGAHLTLVDGSIADAGALVAQWVRERGLYDASTLKEPYRIEGKKTLGFEITTQYEWDPPDVILYPTGGGVGLIGIDKALAELRAIKLIGERRPRLVAVQSSGCAPIVRAWEAKQRESERWQDPYTVAYGINVPKALGDRLILDAVYASDGCAIAIEDAVTVAMQARVARDEDVVLCLEAAATAAAAEELRQRDWIKSGDRVLLINTGTAVAGRP